MEESRSATAALEPTPPQEVPRKPSRRVRLPTSVVVTVFVALLSVWVGPALARQWDDRQKAHELKVSLVTEMAHQTASVLVRSRPGVVGETRAAGEPSFARVQDDWSLGSVEVEAKLRAYFSSRIVREWRTYSTVVGGTLSLWLAFRHPERVPIFGGRLSIAPGIRDVGLSMWEDASADLRKLGLITAEDIKDLHGLVLEPEPEVVGGPRLRREIRNARYINTQGLLLKAEQQIAANVLDAHAAGYSTSARDLLHDLIP